MIDKLAIANAIKARTMTYEEIAKHHGCSLSTVFNVAKENRLGQGRGIKNTWEFTGSNPRLAYLVGAYLTDGTMVKGYETGNIHGISICSTTPEFIDNIRLCMASCKLNPRQLARGGPEGRWGSKAQTSVAVYSSQFGRWLNSECGNKEHIPQFLYSAPKPDAIAFIAAVIDGDGNVSKDGTIRIRKTKNWLIELPELLNSIDIRNSGIRIERVLESGKPYYSMTIRRSDFLAAEGFCVIHHKDERLRHTT